MEVVLKSQVNNRTISNLSGKYSRAAVCARARTTHNIRLLVNLQAVDSPIGIFICCRVSSNVVVACGIQGRVGFVTAGLLPEIIQSGIRSTKVRIENNLVILEVSIDVT